MEGSSTPTIMRRNIRTAESDSLWLSPTYANHRSSNLATTPGNGSGHKGYDNIFHTGPASTPPLHGSNSSSNLLGAMIDDSPSIGSEPRHHKSVSLGSATMISLGPDLPKKSKSILWSTLCCRAGSIFSIFRSFPLIFLFFCLVIAVIFGASILHNYRIDLEHAKKQRLEALIMVDEAEKAIEELKKEVNQEMERIQESAKLEMASLVENLNSKEKELNDVRLLLEQAQIKEEDFLHTIEKFKTSASDIIKIAPDADITVITTNALERLSRFETWLKSTSKLLLESKYGSGPVNVKIETSKGNIVIETAPFDIVPVSVWYFLDKVEKGYWNTATFFDFGHILQISLVSSSGKIIHPENDPLSHVPFQEYNSEFQALPFTLGFSGRPAGPEIYINMKDNSHAHGPGRQRKSFELPGEDIFPEITFAKVIDGIDVIKNIQEIVMEQKKSSDVNLEKPEIKSIQIISES